MALDYRTYMKWLENLAETDRRYLDKNARWRKQFREAIKRQSLPQGFAELTMLILEGGSESEI